VAMAYLSQLFTNDAHRVRLASQTVEEKSEQNKEPNNTAAGIGCVILLFIVGGAFLGGYDRLDGNGYISHDRESVIVAHSTWMVGESKTCSSNATPPTYDVTKSLYCEGTEQHTVTITFHGRTERPDAKDRYGVSWKCVRRTDSFACYALD